jgi:adenylate cyclase
MTDLSEFAQAWIETEDGRREPLGGICRIGRDPESDIVINGAKVSRHHAIIHAQDNAEFWLIDLGSMNGTYVNDQRVLQPTRFRDGDRLVIGGAVFRFRQSGTVCSDPSTGAGGNATVLELRNRDAWLLIVDIEHFIQLSQSLPPDQLAVDVGTWIKKGRRLVEEGGGRISKFLGDGFLACWESKEDGTRLMAEVLTGFHAMREAGPVKFRVVVHHGSVTFGGTVQFGDENILGPEVNYIFRMEKLASALGVEFCLSASAGPRLQSHLSVEPVPGEHELKGYPGRHRCFSVHWP